MIFNEIYSAYYNAVAKVISAALDGTADDKSLARAVSETAFSESVLTVIPSLKSGKWQLLTPDMQTPLTHKPTMPLTTVQKQWLKAVILDPRVKLFGVTVNGLEHIEPLFTTADYRIFDKYADGDNFNDDGYIARFRTILSAVKTSTPLKIKSLDRKGNILTMTVRPMRLEYSEKDDKFRLINRGCRYGGTVNLSRIVECEKCTEYEGESRYAQPVTHKKWVALRVEDSRNALERVMLHFAHFEKQAERLDKDRYLVRICYDKDDETELVIRILSFGPRVEVTEPQDFRNLIIARLKAQRNLHLR